MKKTRVIKNTIMIGLIAVFAGASFLTMSFVGNNRPIGEPTFSQGGKIGDNNSSDNSFQPPARNDNQNAQPNPPQSGNNQQPQTNGNNQSGAPENSAFVPDNKGNLNNQNNGDAQKSENNNENSNSNKSDNNSDKKSESDNKSGGGNNSNNPPGNNHGDNMPGKNFGNHNGQNRNDFRPDNRQQNGGFRQFGNPERKNVVLTLVKYGAVATDSFIIAALVMYLVLSGFNKKGFKETLGEAERIIIFVIGTVLIAVSFIGAQVALTELLARLFIL